MLINEITSTVYNIASPDWSKLGMYRIQIPVSGKIPLSGSFWYPVKFRYPVVSSGIR